MPTDPDRAAMQAALDQARRAIGVSDPNPRVGCVITSPDGQRVLGSGHTQQAGGPHAEVMALRDAQARGADVRGATVHVTLEPCAHHGRTPPCCDALVAAGVGRVVAALGDPNPQVNGQGMARLSAAGIATEWAAPDLAEAARELNIGFLSRMTRGRPWVRLKVAASLDGQTALADGRSQWITGPTARHDGHAWRHRAGAVLSGIGTVRADDPRLDVRGHEVLHQPLRAIVDSRLETPLQARLFEVPDSTLVFYAARPDPERAARLRGLGAQVIEVPGPAGQVDLAAVLADLAGRQLNEVHLECGARLGGAWLHAGLVDELLVYLAPTLLGPGRPMLSLPALPALDQASRWRWVDTCPVGEDLRLRLRPA
jgi:diaminohydroxyphosphoribosylaminopyrimidine deaminase/5-amino-6-(5-phosphoribosylamino)uracil reductase